MQFKELAMGAPSRTNFSRWPIFLAAFDLPVGTMQYCKPACLQKAESQILVATTARKDKGAFQRLKPLSRFVVW